MQKTVYVRDEKLFARAVELGGGMSASAIIEEAVKRWVASKAVAHRLDAVARLALECLEDLQEGTPAEIGAQIGATADEVHRALRRHNLRALRTIAYCQEQNLWFNETYAEHDADRGTWVLLCWSTVDDE